MGARRAGRRLRAAASPPSRAPTSSPTEVVSSDFCRGLVADDENDQSATPDAFDVLHYIAGTRLRRGLLTVVDATNVQQPARAVAGRARPQPRRAGRRDRARRARRRSRSSATRRGPTATSARHVVRRQQRDLDARCGRLQKEGFRRVHVLRGVDEIDGADDRPRAPVQRPHATCTGPFDIIGDVHGCRSELGTLLTELGWKLEYDGDRPSAPPTPRAAGGLRRRPGRPRPGHPRRAAPGHGHGRGRQRAVRVRQPRGQAGPRAQGPQGHRLARPGRVAGRSWSAEADEFRSGRAGASSTG